MSPFWSLLIGAVFIGLAFLLRGQPGYNRLGFVMMNVAGAAWLVAALFGYLNR